MKFIATLLAGGALALAAAPAQAEWVASWTAAPHAPLGTQGPFAASSYENVTLAQILRVTEGGSRLRVKFSNRYGPGPLAIGEARIVQIDEMNREISGTFRMEAVPAYLANGNGQVVARPAPRSDAPAKVAANQ